VFGNSDRIVPPCAWSDLARESNAGARTEVWAWKSIRRRAEQPLARAR